ncbi:MAG: hypothetical protein KC731_02540 [Myxococcales bacterium]|nr:hypothetical protein [Myxococcales bacterium]
MSCIPRARLLLCLAFALPTTSARAAQGEDPVALFEDGAAAFKAGRFEVAIAAFEASYALEPNPVLLYNMARAYEGLDRQEPALDHYRRYLEADPDTADRGAVEARIAALDKELARRRELEARRNQPPPAPVPVTPTDGPSAVPWVVAGVGAAGLGVGAILGVLAKGKESDAAEEPVANEADALAADGRALALGATISFIAGGVILAGGVTWGVVDLTTSDAPPSRARLRLELGPGSASLRGRF